MPGFFFLSRQQPGPDPTNLPITGRMAADSINHHAKLWHRVKVLPQFKTATEA